MTVKIVTDSVSDLPPKVVKELGITVVPLHVRFGDEVFRNGSVLIPVRDCSLYRCWVISNCYRPMET